MTFDALIAETLAALRKAGYAAAEDALGRAEAVATSEADLALVQIHRASIPVLQGSRGAEWNVFRENIVRRHSPKHVQLSAYYIVVNAIDRNDRTAAERYLPVMLDAAHALGEPGTTVAVYDAAAAVESMRGNHVAAIEYSKAAFLEAEQYEGPDATFTRAGVAHNVAYNCLAGNELAEALRYINIALPYAERLGNPDVLRQVLLTAAFTYLMNDRLDEAERFTGRAEPLAAGMRLEQYVHYVRGEIARRRGNHVTAKEHFRRIEAFYPEMPGVAEMLLSMNFAPFLMPE
ncbi:MAG TPA: hypothetical protein VEK57_31290 [Thermoanaerobaculia bacterium]|nr:hypothetical protein [Thermoanaerobaculia bacterium]